MFWEVPVFRGQIVFTLTEVPVVSMMEKEASRLRPPVRIFVKSFVLGMSALVIIVPGVMTGEEEGAAFSCGRAHKRSRKV